MTHLKIRLPAEWEPQSAILLTWPHKGTDWKDQLSNVEAIYYTLAKAILAEQKLIISCEDPRQLAHITQTLCAMSPDYNTRLSSFVVPSDDTWVRDHGPISVIQNNTPTLLDYNFNAWGGKYKANKDNNITQHLFKLGAFPHAQHAPVNFILEGGSIESDGRGTLLTTERCLLSPTRNSHFNKSEIEEQLKKNLGVDRILWLKHGYLKGDDTDAHIDTLVRFCNPNTLCYVSCNDENDEHFEELKAMEYELKSFTSMHGDPYKLIKLPMPTAIYATNNERLPATYANFLITNASVLLPTYNTPEDRQAVTQLEHCFPNKKIVPIDCSALIQEHGSLHCITMQLTEGTV
mgnify:CR=1 FL=1